MPSFRVLPVSPDLVIVAVILAFSPSLGCGRVGFDLLPKPEECNPSASRDVTCDGVDDDCDGKIDEDFQGRSTMCGVGACAGNRAELTCEDGREVNSCDPLEGAADADEQCDGVDDDCDGEVDEDFASMSTTCGVGVCAGNTGATTCTRDGMLLDSCDPLDGAGGDETSCDGVDNDCDGEVDEDFVPTQTFCGTGVCSGNTGERTCSTGGVLVDTCDPLEGAANDDASNDGLDDDCDGDVDEDVACVGSTSTFTAGATTVPVPTNCTTASVRLWGGAGSTAEDGGNWSFGLTRGDGGAGGYAAGVVAVDNASTLTLYVGTGAANCTTRGSNAGGSIYAGGDSGAGRGEDGMPGQDGAVVGGGAGGDPGGAPTIGGGLGGMGHYGGGGGGAGGSPGASYPHGRGGSGGAASVFLFDGGRIVAGGGGGGGGMGANFVTSLGEDGGNAGSGCSEDGKTGPNSAGGGGGGGGLCEVVGAASPDTQPGPDRTPYAAGDLPAGTAVGGAGDGGASADCLPGGDGYAIITFSP